MLRTVNKSKVKQIKPRTRKIVFTASWLILVGAALAFMAIAGHV